MFLDIAILFFAFTISLYWVSYAFPNSKQKLLKETLFWLQSQSQLTIHRAITNIRMEMPDNINLYIFENGSISIQNKNCLFSEGDVTSDKYQFYCGKIKGFILASLQETIPVMGKIVVNPEQRRWF